MASFKVKLIINEEERNVLNVDQAFRQVVDITGRPEGRPYGEPLYLTLESTVDDSYFYHHTISPSNMIEGEIIFYKRDGYTVLYKLEFANAYFLGLQEEFNAVGEVPLNFTLKIGWGITKVNGVVFEEQWNPDNPYEAVGAATVIEDNEPEVIESYYTDLEGNIQPEPRTGEEIFLVLKTQNAVGDSIDIDLSDNTRDFMYNDEVLEDDMLRDFEITSDLHKIKLRVVQQLEQGEELETIATTN